MDTTKKKDAVRKTATVSAPDAETKPIKQFRIDGTQGSVSVSIFARGRLVQGKPITFYSVSLSRSYQTRTGEWKRVKSFDRRDLSKLGYLIDQAANWLEDRERESEVRNAPDEEEPAIVD